MRPAGGSRPFPTSLVGVQPSVCDLVHVSPCVCVSRIVFVNTCLFAAPIFGLFVGLGLEGWAGVQRMRPAGGSRSFLTSLLCGPGVCEWSAAVTLLYSSDTLLLYNFYTGDATLL